MTKEDAKKKLGANIKALRFVWGETQDNLAYALGLEENTNISYYENGKRYPKRDIISKIAKHYRITEYELMYSDFTGSAKLPLSKKQNSESVKKDLSIIFPIKETEEALQNKSFKRACELHKNFYECVTKSVDFIESDADECIKLYRKAFDEGVLEAAVNYLSLIFLFGYSLCILTPELCENFENRDADITSLSELISYGFLPNFTDNSQEEYDELNDIRIDFICENNKTILMYINKLKRSKCYAFLGDYYLALRYMFGMVNNNLSVEMNNTIGYEMMITFAAIGNKYARAFIELGKNFLNN